MIFWHYAPIKQRIVAAIDEQRVVFQFEMSVLGRVKLRWRTDEKQGTAVLGRSWGNGVWFEREIPIGPTN